MAVMGLLLALIDCSFNNLAGRMDFGKLPGRPVIHRKSEVALVTMENYQFRQGDIGRIGQPIRLLSFAGPTPSIDGIGRCLARFRTG
jgi:hypothetical protein